MTINKTLAWVGLRSYSTSAKNHCGIFAITSEVKLNLKKIKSLKYPPKRYLYIFLIWSWNVCVNMYSNSLSPIWKLEFTLHFSAST